MKTRTIPTDLVTLGARVVADEGPDALTMDRLARETGLSRATLYRQCGSREALLDAIAARGADVGDRTDTRARILAGAREVFGRVGFDAATIDDVASTAGVGTATVYRHFGDKDGLVTAFLDNIAPRRAARSARATATDDVRADLVRLATEMLRGAKDDGAVVRLIMVEALRGSALVDRVRKASPLRTITAIASLLRHHVEAGHLRDLDPAVLAQSFGGMVFSFGVIGPALRGEQAGDPVATAETITDLFLRGALATRRTR